MRATLDILRPSVYLTLPKTVNRSTIKQGNRDILRWYIKKMDRTLETNHCMRLGYKQGSWGSASVCVCVCVWRGGRSVRMDKMFFKSPNLG